MSISRSFAGVKHILCPTDLSARSQQTLRYAVQMAEASGSKLTAFHCISDTWLHRSGDDVRQVGRRIEREIIEAFNDEAGRVDFDVVVERASDPALRIVRLSRTLGADLIVMKARPGVLSALHFGSIVERIVSRTESAVMLMPSRFVASRNVSWPKKSFERILFDYDFSQATDELFRVANALTRNYQSELHVLSVLEPPFAKTVSSSFGRSQAMLENAIQSRLLSAVRSEGRSPTDVHTTVQWGPHADRLLKYAQKHDIDLICTALPTPNYSFEMIYRIYLGRLLATAQCPVLVKQCV